MYATMPLGLFPGWGQRSSSRMMLMIKYLVQVSFDSFEVPAFTSLGPSLEHRLLVSATMPLVRSQGGDGGQYLG